MPHAVTRTTFQATYVRGIYFTTRKPLKELTGIDLNLYPGARYTPVQASSMFYLHEGSLIFRRLHSSHFPEQLLSPVRLVFAGLLFFSTMIINDCILISRE